MSFGNEQRENLQAVAIAAIQQKFLIISVQIAKDIWAATLRESQVVCVVNILRLQMF